MASNHWRWSDRVHRLVVRRWHGQDFMGGCQWRNRQRVRGGNGELNDRLKWRKVVQRACLLTLLISCFEGDTYVGSRWINRAAGVGAEKRTCASTGNDDGFHLQSNLGDYLRHGLAAMIRVLAQVESPERYVANSLSQRSRPKCLLKAAHGSPSTVERL
jgi:hypothetical protein